MADKIKLKLNGTSKNSKKKMVLVGKDQMSLCKEKYTYLIKLRLMTLNKVFQEIATYIKFILTEVLKRNCLFSLNTSKNKRFILFTRSTYFNKIKYKVNNTDKVLANEYGVYSIKLIWRGVPKEVIIDDQFPCNKRNTICSHYHGNELYLILK